MVIRKVLVATLGHVDHGKTSLLDKIRKTVVAKGEAGGITQAIGVSIIPIEAIKKICGKLMDVFKGNLTIPGLLCIDTPGHAAFTSLRKRGGSLADLAILVVDINEGFKPQTIESVEILKANKVPFVIAANKVDLIGGWKSEVGKNLIENINLLDYNTQGQFEKKMYEIVAQVGELGFQAERFDRVQDYSQQIAIVPVSAHTGQGIPELLMVLAGLTQKFLEKQLQVEEFCPTKGTILEVKEEKGLGKTLNVLLYNGSLKVNDQIVIGGIGQPIVAKIRALLEPEELAEMRDKKSKFVQVKEVTAATGVKISAPGLDEALAGMPLRACSGSASEIEKLKQEVQEEVGEIVKESSDSQGVIIKSDTIGGLEALRVLLQDKKIPISSSAIGDVSKKDLSQLESLRDKDESQAVLLGFNIKIPPEIEEIAKNKNIKIITEEVIYKLIEGYESFVEQLKKEVELRELALLVRPGKFFIMKGYTFRQNNPAIVGIEIEAGQVKSGDPVMNEHGKSITEVKSMQEGKDNVNTAKQGQQLAMALDNVTVGRQINEGDFLYTDTPENDFKKLKVLKKHLSPRELDVLREIAEIKRK